MYLTVLPAKKQFHSPVEGWVLCLLVVVALTGAPVGHVAYASAGAQLPAQGLDHANAPQTDPCMNPGRCNVACRGGDRKLLVLWASGPRVPDPFALDALPRYMSGERVPSVAVAPTRSLVDASQQATYLFTGRLRL